MVFDQLLQMTVKQLIGLPGALRLEVMPVHRFQHFKPFLQRSQQVLIDNHLPGLAVFGPAELFLLFLEQNVLIGKRPDGALQRIFFVAEDALLHFM
ncbi:hypothetical protein D3C75_1015100 [compost metagenome]